MAKLDLSRIAKLGWLQRWAGSYTFISCSYWGPQYHHSLKKILNIGFNHTLFIHKKGTVSFYVSNSEFRNLGRYLANKSVKNGNFAKKYCLALKKNTDVLVPIMNRLGHKIPTWQEYKTFQTAFDRHLAYHVFVKKTIDFLPVKVLNKLLATFKDARLYSERIYSQTEVFFRNVIKVIAKKEGHNANYLTCLTQEEFENYLRTEELPKPAVLKQRFNASALYFENNVCHLILGSDVAKLEKLLLKDDFKHKHQLKGIVGYPGKVRGVARIVPDPFKVKLFNNGDVLITGMTRPEFMPYIKRSSAIVTESGGILSHAAIIARELKKPCIVGTQIATKIFKNGDLVEVNADRGTIKKLN